MKIKSLSKIYDDIIHIIDVNPLATNFGIITNQFAGEDYLISKIIKYYESKSKTKIILVEANELESIDSLKNHFQSIIQNDFGENSFVKLNNNSYSDLIISFLIQMFSFNVEKIIFISNHFELLNSEDQYRILSQFRNIREKIKIQKKLAACHFIIFGSFSYFEQIKFCQQYGTSSTLDNVFYICNSNKEEQNLILNDLNIKNDENKNLIEIIQDLTGGAIGLLIFVANMNLPENINVLTKELINNSYIHSFLLNKFEKLCSDQTALLFSIIENKQLFLKFNQDLEKLYFMGIVNIVESKNKLKVYINSWLTELHLKKIISKNKREYLTYNQLLPLNISLNYQAYIIIMEIENYLRNTLISKLSLLNYKDHPLDILDCLGKIKSTDFGKNYTYYEWCKHKMYQNVNVYNADLYDSLVSQLDLSDLENIFLSDTVPIKYSTKSLKDLLNIPLKEGSLSEFFKKLKQIRNPIAHNQIINFSVIKNLNGLKNILLD